jgi:hypothetical protein
MGIQRVQTKEVVRWASRAGTRDFCSALAALVGQVQNIYFLTVHFPIPLSPSPSNLGMQPCWVACLLVRVSGDADYGKHWFRSSLLLL